jgi:hypothetical protein
MPKFCWHVRESQIALFRKYCKEQSAALHETPGYPFRRLIFFLSTLLMAEVSLGQIEAGIAMLVELHKNDCCCIKAKSQIKKIITVLKED